MITIKQRNEIISYVQEATRRLEEQNIRATRDIKFYGKDEYRTGCDINIYTEHGTKYGSIHLNAFDTLMDSSATPEEGIEEIKRYVDINIDEYIESEICEKVHWAYPMTNAVENFMYLIAGEFNHLDETLNAKVHFAGSGHYYITLCDMLGEEYGTISYGTNLRTVYYKLNKSILKLYKFICTYSVDAFCNLYGCTYKEAFGYNMFIAEYYDTSVFTLI